MHEASSIGTRRLVAFYHSINDILRGLDDKFLKNLKFRLIFFGGVWKLRASLAQATKAGNSKQWSNKKKTRPKEKDSRIKKFAKTNKKKNKNVIY